MNPLEPEKTADKKDQRFAPPAVGLPKGGGAIKGIGEKFAANPVTGTGSMSVPILTSPGRSGFGPQLSLAYDSGAGNGPFGFGWSLSLPSIARKTDKGLPQYDDVQESDVFILSGAEDLVPLLQPDGTRFEDDITAPGFTIRRYRPRIEGLFARIERWTRDADGDVHWRSISRDNILTIYGKDSKSRITDPVDPHRVFTWLICETRDDKGNAVLYEYKPEDGAGVDLARAHERNRGDRDDPRRATNRYLKRVRYGNRVSLLGNAAQRPRSLSEDQIRDAGWMFEVVLDYGEHDAEAPKPDDAGLWTYRKDAFSSYRAGFEVRTGRLCQRVLMFHHFAGEAGVERDCLVRSTDFTYSHEQDPDNASNPVYTFLLSVSQSGYKRNNGGYLRRSLPPVEYEYTQPIVQETVEEVDAASLENLPIGLDGAGYQWTDLHGEGIPGILTEQAGAWFYKRNLSPVSDHPVEFAPLECVATKPNLTLAGGQVQFMDLAGNGQPDLVVLGGPTPGLYQHDQDEDWQPFRPFTSRLNRDIRDPNLKFIDLDGDGHTDVLITEDDAFVWHASLEEEGFGHARRVVQERDEEKGPRLVFADTTQSIYVADLSGDGLAQLVRIRNGEVCYWPNLGYGRFGAKVTMDQSPQFDNQDQFDHQRIRLADIDGSGTTDIIYLHRDGVRLYFNQSGNSWSEAKQLKVFPRVDDVVSIVTIDLLGNGTACLVWSSPLPGDTRRPMRYVNLMGGRKPHLLVKTMNNLGAETVVSYAPSTKFYLADKLAGKPWITKLPFPVHCVEKVTVTDKWRQTAFSTTYSYHHGYFDGIEREFRGFGRVEQLDVESYGKFTQGNTNSPYISGDQTLYQPPVKTVTWYHTGALLERERILSQFAHEYFPRWFEDLRPEITNVLGSFQENVLPEPDLAAEGLSAEEWREALRACKGMMLRQEVYELDVDALERTEHLPVKLFSTAYHNCHISRLQAKAINKHAVFLVTESEAITYNYELDLRPDTLRPDPRVAHTLNLQFDEFGNVLQSVAVAYPRLGQFVDNTLPADAVGLIRRVQQETHLAYSESRYTNDVEEVDNYRLRVPCEMLTYELTGLGPEDADDQSSADPRDNRYFTLDELRRFRLSLVHQTAGAAVPEIAYHELPTRTSPQKRLVEHVRLLFFQDDSPALSDPLPFGELDRRGLLYESYKLALTDGLLSAVFTDAAGNKLDQIVGGATTVRALLGNPVVSGYLSGALLAARFAGIDTTGQHWIRSGIAGFAPDAPQHFYLPERYTDPFGNVTTVEYDSRDLFVASSTDALGNTTRVRQFDFRALAPRELQDINDNLSEVYFDVLGLPTAMALKGKGNEGDSLTGFNDTLANPAIGELVSFFVANPIFNESQARTWLGQTTARHLYYLGETRNPDGSITWGAHPPCAAGILRETHVSQLVPDEPSLLQASFEYSDGMGSVLVTKVQAEPEAPGQPLRWVANGKTILNNKGKPVKQYEPYFSPPEVGHRFEEPREEGITPVIYYDAAGRTVRTEMPDGSFSRIEFSPWQAATYDPNDTVRDSSWYLGRNPVDPAQPLPRDPITGRLQVTEEQRSAWLAAQHHDTPSLSFLDSLGRDVVSIAHNRFTNTANQQVEEKHITFTRLDAEGKPLWIRDARRNLVMQYITPPAPDGQGADPVDGFVPCYDIAGNLLFQHSMDAGDRWMLNDAAGKPMFAWDSRGHIFRSDYDALHRPVATFITGADPQNPNREIQFEKVIYGDTPANGLTVEPGNDQTKRLNLRGQAYKFHDSAGIVVSMGRNPVTGLDEAFDFKGNLLRSSRQLVLDYKRTPDWSQLPDLENETFGSAIRYDALNRPTQVVAPHSNRAGTKLNILRPGYNEAKLLERVDAWLGQSAEPGALFDVSTATDRFVGNIDYNAKGQRTQIRYGNGVTTTYQYEALTFRLAHLLTDRGAGFADDRPNPPDPPRGGIQNLSYFYDPVGNITRIRDDAQQTIFFNGQKVEPSTDYEYDAIYRLMSATGREHIGQNASPQVNEDDAPRMNRPLPTDAAAMRIYTERYDYDPVGNILRMIHQAGALGAANGSWTRRYDYEATNNRLRATSLPGDGDGVFSARYLYDPHGNMTRMPHLPLMRWDFRDQLQATSKQVVNNGGTPETTHYVYDSGGQRVRKVTDNQAGAGQTSRRMKERIYLGGFEVYREFESDGDALKLERETLHVMDDKQRIALVETRTDTPVATALIRYQFSNHLGSASVELDELAQIITYEEYYPFGSASYQAVRTDVEVSPKRYRYTAMERDEETGFGSHGERYYAAWLGRWLNCDPIGVQGGHNLYRFAKNNPLVFKDTSGLDPLRLSSHGVGEKLSDDDVEPRIDGVGQLILSHWLHGGGDTLYLTEGTSDVPTSAREVGMCGHSKMWILPVGLGAYMWKGLMVGVDDKVQSRDTLRDAMNKVLLDAVDLDETKSILEATYLNSGPVEPPIVDYAKAQTAVHLNMPNGEGTSGHSYLHGSNSTVGDVTVAGQIISPKELIGPDTYKIQIKFHFAWNDVIDPNKRYASDNSKAQWARRAGMLYGFTPKDYRIKVEWNRTLEATVTRRGVPYEDSIVWRSIDEGVKKKHYDSQEENPYDFVQH